MISQRKVDWQTDEGPFGFPAVDVEWRGDEIHVWWATLDLTEPRRKTLTKVLSVEEERRGERFRFDRDRARYRVGRSLLRVILGQYLHVSPSDVQFIYGEHGKPMLQGSNLSFNMSKSAGCAVFAVTTSRRIGIDIEQLRDMPELDQIARRHFTEAEWSRLRSCEGHRRKEMFFKCWTRKEAFVKAVGQGLSIPLDSFDVSGAPDESSRWVKVETDVSGACPFRVYDLQVEPDFAASVALEEEDHLLQTRQSSTTLKARHAVTCGTHRSDGEARRFLKGLGFPAGSSVVASWMSSRGLNAALAGKIGPRSVYDSDATNWDHVTDYNSSI